MSGTLRNAIINTEEGAEQIFVELYTLKGVIEKLPKVVANLLDGVIIDERIYHNSFFDELHEAIQDVTATSVQGELVGIKNFIDSLMNTGKK